MANLLGLYPGLLKSEGALQPLSENCPQQCLSLPWRTFRHLQALHPISGGVLVWLQPAKTTLNTFTARWGSRVLKLHPIAAVSPHPHWLSSSKKKRTAGVWIIWDTPVIQGGWRLQNMVLGLGNIAYLSILLKQPQTFPNHVTSH